MNLMIIVISTCFTWFLLRELILRLGHFVLDSPNTRSSHLRPTPRGGGVAFVVVASVSSGIALMNDDVSAIAALPLLVCPLAVVGLLDDRFNLSASFRYVVQLLTGLLVLVSSPLVKTLGLAKSSDSWLIVCGLAVLLITFTAVVNFTNFMDGLDGLVAGCMVVAISALAIRLSVPWPFWSLVGSLLGFLLWNWSPAKVFMGDVGSYFLGAVFAGLLFHAPCWQESLGLLLVATPLLADACLCLSRRLLARQNVFQAHRLHLFQRLHQAGWSHASVSFFYISSTFVLSAVFLSGGLPWVLGFSFVVLSVGVWLDQYVAMPFHYVSNS